MLVTSHSLETFKEVSKMILECTLYPTNKNCKKIRPRENISAEAAESLYWIHRWKNQQLVQFTSFSHFKLSGMPVFFLIEEKWV